MLFSTAATQSPIQFGPYLLTECVGQGGMAVVYRATRRGPNGFEKTVVVKAMLPTLSVQREFVSMFSAEARLMAALCHPNIVQVHDFGVVDGIPYLAMEYLPGRNLSQLRAALAAANLKLPVGAALTIARELCHGLGYAHALVDADGRRRHIIHRDVSPSNVMVCRDGSVKLLDFGVAKIVGEFDYDATQSFKGKYAYMAPEQVNHQTIDRRVDVFAAGIVIHELLTGRRLFAAPTELETLQRVSAAQVIAPSVDNSEVPRALDVIVKKALAREPGDRYASGGELAEALESLDALAWPRKRLAAYVSELFAGDWMVTCEVCGKTVLPGAECGECGTEAPAAVEPQPHIAADARARSARQALVPLLGPLPTERNLVDVAAAPAAPTPAGADEPQPLPPPPAAVRKTARGRLSVVRTPLPPPLPPPLQARPPLPPAPADLASANEPPTEKTVMPPLASSDGIDEPSEPPPSPPKLFVVPRPMSIEMQAFITPGPPPPAFALPVAPPLAPSLAPTDSGVRMPMSPLATPRPSAPQPLFVVPPTPPPLGATPNLRGDSRIVWYAMAAAVATAVLAGTLIARSSDRPAVAPVEPTVTPAPAPTRTPTMESKPLATPLRSVATTTTSSSSTTLTTRPTPPPTTPPPSTPPPTTTLTTPPTTTTTLTTPPPTTTTRPTLPTVVRAKPAQRTVRHRVARPRPEPEPVAAEPERTVKEGRLVDPFAGLK